MPARELSLEEIRSLCETKLCDIEVFVHGALCICYSGQCQLSRYYGGRSGNRGQCAQPCRLPYNGRDVHPLSPKDMCRLSDLGDLIEAGVYSFKIEGRMKSPEYVAVVTRLYRKYIDLYLETGSLTVSEEDMEELRQIFNRGRFTDAYLHGNPGDELMSMVVPKNQGIEIGHVTGVKNNSTLVDARLTGELAIGDGVEIRGGGRQSGNTRRLADLAAQSGISTYHIEQAEELRAEDFAGKGRVGLTAGASTPRKIIDATQQWLEQLPD